MTCTCPTFMDQHLARVRAEVRPTVTFETEEQQ